MIALYQNLVPGTLETVSPMAQSLHVGKELPIISNNPIFCHKHPVVPDGSDGSDRASYHLPENYTLPVAQATGCFSYIPHLLCSRNVVT